MFIGMGMRLYSSTATFSPPPPPFSPSDLFSSGQQGAWYEPYDLTTLSQNSTGTTPVTAAGQPVGRMLDKSGRSNTATQATAAARPTYQVSPARLTLDKVDDRLTVTVPTGGWIGTMVIGTTSGTASYGVSIPAGAYEIGGKTAGLWFPGTALVGQIVRNGALSGAEATSVEAYMASVGATASYGAVTDFSLFWRDRVEITSFPLINTGSGTSLQGTWQSCTGMTSFPLINTSAATNLFATWYGCSGLTSFPAINTASATSFQQAWFGCTSLTSFPALNFSSAAVVQGAWSGCTNLASFPSGVFNSSPNTNFTNAFLNCALTQTSVDNILVSINAAGTSTGTLNTNGGTSAAPSATGLIAKNALIARGWTVTTN